MVCSTCGRNVQNEEANFCEYCGSPFKEHLKAAYQEAPKVQSDGMAGPIPIQDKANELPISFLNWLGTYGILFATMFIPLIGWAIYLGVLFAWAFSSRTPVSKKNWARVTLIFTAVLVILVVIYMMILLNSGLFQQILNGSFDLKSYEALYQNLYK